METLQEKLTDEQQSSFDCWHDDIRRTVGVAVRRQVRCVAEADEIVQDVMFELWTKSDRIDWSTGCPHGWAATIAKRRAIDRVRSDQSRTKREERVDRERASSVNLVAEDVIVRLDRERVVGALDVLNHKQREAIVLAYFDDRSYADVARLLGLPEGTVKRRIRDGLVRLRAKLVDLR